MLCFFCFCLQNIFWAKSLMQINARFSGHLEWTTDQNKLTYKHYPQEDYSCIIHKQLKSKLKVNVRLLQMVHNGLPDSDKTTAWGQRGKKISHIISMVKESQKRQPLGTPSGYNWMILTNSQSVWCGVTGFTQVIFLSLELWRKHKGKSLSLGVYCLYCLLFLLCETDI